jgi:hypothetical protein
MFCKAFLPVAVVLCTFKMMYESKDMVLQSVAMYMLKCNQETFLTKDIYIFITCTAPTK